MDEVEGAAHRLRAMTLRTLGIATLVAMAAALVLGISTTKRPDQVSAQLERFGVVEKQVVAAYEAGREKYVKQEISDAAFADIIERDVLPPWQRIGFDLAAFRSAPPEAQEFVRNYDEHHDLREQAWQSMVVGLRTGDRRAMERAAEKIQQANALLEKVRKQANEKRDRAK